MSNDLATESLNDSGIELNASTDAPHPEEMRGTVRLRIGKWMSVDATARATPAGFVALALLVTAIAAPLLIARKRRRAP